MARIVGTRQRARLDVPQACGFAWPAHTAGLKDSRGCRLCAWGRSACGQPRWRSATRRCLSTFEREWQVCSGCRRWPTAGVPTLTGSKRSLEPATGAGPNGRCTRCRGRESPTAPARQPAAVDADHIGIARADEFHQVLPKGRPALSRKLRCRRHGGAGGEKLGLLALVGAAVVLWMVLVPALLPIVRSANWISQFGHNDAQSAPMRGDVAH